MSAQDPALFSSEARGNWLRLRTFTMLRWIAITGQIAAIIIAKLHFDLQLDLGAAGLAVGAAIVVNLVSIIAFPRNKRLSELQALAVLLFDTKQLGVLIYLTGGLHNPCALLLVIPVAISATALHLRSTIVLGMTVLTCASLLAICHVPLTTETGSVLRIPDMFVFGFWITIVIGTIFLGIYARHVTLEIHSMSDALLATQMALSREQKLTDLGGVVAAAAHELGTPLATIKLASSELMEDLGDRPELREDVELIRRQAERCHEILRSMGRAGKEDAHLRSAPLSAVIGEAAEPHLNRGMEVILSCIPCDEGKAEPEILRKPELIHGIRNLVQNAVDFAASRVWVEMNWSADGIAVRIADDGPGFADDVIDRIGDPFIHRGRGITELQDRPEYEEMGLGLFIAKILLEHSGAKLSFANGADTLSAEADKTRQRGAIIEVVWPRGNRGPEARAPRRPLGKNKPFEA